MNPDKIPMSPAALRFKAALQAEGRREGLAEGRREGLAEGERKGLAEGERKGLAEGERKGLAEGERNALRTLLRTRGLSATAEEQALIEDCTDPKRLEQ